MKILKKTKNKNSAKYIREHIEELFLLLKGSAASFIVSHTGSKVQTLLMLRHKVLPKEANELFLPPTSVQSKEFATTQRCQDLEQRHMERFRGINRITKGRVCGLYGQVPQEDRMSLDTVAFLIIVGGVEQLPRQICPLSSDGFTIQFPHSYQKFLKGKHPTRVNTLKDNRHAGNVSHSSDIVFLSCTLLVTILEFVHTARSVRKKF